MSAAMIGMSFLVLGVILLLGKWIRVMSPPIQKLFIPSSLIGGSRVYLLDLRGGVILSHC